MNGGAKRSVSDDAADIQGLILRGYGPLPEARFVLLSVPETARKPAVKAWVGRLADRVRFGRESLRTPSLNVAFTRRGLDRLGLDTLTNAAGVSASRQFVAPFEVGMTTEHRSRILGDTDHNGSAPTGWQWGGPRNPVDVLLLLYAETEPEVLALLARETADTVATGLTIVHTIESRTLRGDTEQFGFRDGITNPQIKGLEDEGDALEPGEFLLGYANEYGVYAPRPRIVPSDDPSRLLPLDEEEPGAHDFGRNGSYLVVRQLQQRPWLFWSTLNALSGGDAAKRELLAAEMVGRWRSGAPIVKARTADDPRLSEDNDFTYHHDDPRGLGCPVGAHIRRTNPRDSLDPDPGTERSLAVNKRHRILRRGRPYGSPPVAEPIDPKRILADGEAYDAEERGIVFMCFNANISRQFEFIQESWLNNPKFAGLHGDPDPLMGDRGASRRSSFTIPACPVRRRVTGLPQFVQVRGGAYFFMPGRRALRFLSRLPD